METSQQQLPLSIFFKDDNNAIGGDNASMSRLGLSFSIHLIRRNLGGRK